MKVTYETTPNPNALKCVTDRELSQHPRSFLSEADADGDPLAGPLFATGSVRAVLINGPWITVNKLPEADWKALKPLIEKVICAAFRDEPDSTAGA
ncbi:MAG: NifU N-terminal domain-containing protein [Planctomycetota bacterium]